MGGRSEHLYKHLQKKMGLHFVIGFICKYEDSALVLDARYTKKQVTRECRS